MCTNSGRAAVSSTWRLRKCVFGSAINTIHDYPTSTWVPQASPVPSSPIFLSNLSPRSAHIALAQHHRGGGLGCRHYTIGAVGRGATPPPLRCCRCTQHCRCTNDCCTDAALLLVLRLLHLLRCCTVELILPSPHSCTAPLLYVVVTLLM